MPVNTENRYLWGETLLYAGSGDSLRNHRDSQDTPQYGGSGIHIFKELSGEYDDEKVWGTKIGVKQTNKKPKQTMASEYQHLH